MYQAHHILAIVGENVDSAAVVAKMGRIKERYAIDKIIYSNEGEENIIKAINEYEAIFIGDIEKSLQK